jgi:hypothetical protein
MIFATAAYVIPFLISAAPAAPKGLAHTAIIHPDFYGHTVLKGQSRRDQDETRTLLLRREVDRLGALV